MKLLIQIPCFNEAETLPLVFAKMPKTIPGIDVIEYQIIDDGSTDKTIAVAKQLGIHHIIKYPGKNRRWLGRTFKRGVYNALALNADILVNTDGDNQYPSEMIPELIKPILEKRAEIVIGDRKPHKIAEFSSLKRFLQKFGSKFVGFMAGAEVNDAVSGFRAYSREALLRLNILTDFTYTVDTLMQAHKKGLDIVWIPISVNAKTRESRLIKSLWHKVKSSGATILRMYLMYEPFKTFFYLSILFVVPGILLILRFLFYYITDSPRASGLIQSLIIGSLLTIAGFQVFTLGILADLIKINRRLQEDALYILKQKYSVIKK